MSLRAAAVVAVVVVLAVALAGAAPARADETAEAKSYYISGTRHFDLSEYAEALRDFKEAYRIKPDPVFLYNIAQCHRILKHNDEALSFYRSFLRRAPETPHRREVEAKIAALEEAIATQNKASKMPPDRVLESGARPPGSAGEPPPPATTAPAATPPATALVVSQPAPAAERTPVYKKWWLWTAVGAVVLVGVGVGLGVGLTRNGSSPAGTQFPGVSF
jgi:tetratricopeptide (TPR) repeat protein